MGSKRNCCRSKKTNKIAKARKAYFARIKASPSSIAAEKTFKKNVIKEKRTTSKLQSTSILHNSFNTSHSGQEQYVPSTDDVMSQVHEVLIPKIEIEDSEVGDVFTHYLAQDIDLQLLPFGWAPLLLPNKLQLLRVKDETVVMYVDITRDKIVTLKIQNELKLSVPHNFDALMSNYHAIETFMDLVELLKELDECFNHATVTSVNVPIQDSEVCTPHIAHDNDDDDDSDSTDDFPMEPISLKIERVESNYSSTHQMQDDEEHFQDSTERISPLLFKDVPDENSAEVEEILKCPRDRDSTSDVSQQQLFNMDSVMCQVTDTHYLAKDFNIQEFPFGWAPLFVLDKLQVFKVEDESFVMCVEVTREKKVFLKVLSEKLPESNKYLPPKCSTVKCFMDLIQLLKKLEKWFTLIHR